MGSTIIGCGKSLPKLEVANDELKALVDTNDEWISTRTGIRSRHVAVEETATDLAEAAARQALGLADGGWREDGEAIDPASIDLVIYATITPDVLVPSAAGLLRRRLGLENAIAFDLNAACGLRVRPDRGRVHDGRFDRRSARCRGPQPRSPRARGGSRAPDARDGLERP